MSSIQEWICWRLIITVYFRPPSFSLVATRLCVARLAGEAEVACLNDKSLAKDEEMSMIGTVVLLELSKAMYCWAV